MQRKILITYIIILAAAVLGLAYFAASIKTNPNSTASPSVSQSASSSVSPSNSASPTENIVTYTSSGFSPASITVTAGTTVQFLNQSSQDIWVASNPHPVHTDYPEFDSKSNIKPGESYTFVFTRKGTWGYHNHLNPEQGGTVTVQ